MNNIELKAKVGLVAGSILKEKGFIAPVDLLQGLGKLAKQDYENWRRGRVPYLEKVCTANLSKLSLIMKELEMFARQNNLKPSWTGYNQWGVKGKKIRLRFSKSGEMSIETGYATHYVLKLERGVGDGGVSVSGHAATGDGKIGLAEAGSR